MALRGLKALVKLLNAAFSMTAQDNGHVDPVDIEATEHELAWVADADLITWGMGCINCAARVRNSLLSEKGIIDVRRLTTSREEVL